MFTYSIKWVHEMRKFHVTFVQWRLRNLQKGCLLFDCHFANINILLFCHACCHCHRYCLSSQLLWCSNFGYNKTSSFFSLLSLPLNSSTGGDARATLDNLLAWVLPSDTWLLYQPVLKAIFSQLLLHAQEKKERNENRHRKGNIPVNQMMCLKNIVHFNRKSLKSNRFKLDQNNKSGWFITFILIVRRRKPWTLSLYQS